MTCFRRTYTFETPHEHRPSTMDRLPRNPLNPIFHHSSTMLPPSWNSNSLTPAASCHRRRQYQHTYARIPSSIGEPTTSKEAIELAILRSNQSRSAQKQASTKFSISRSSRPRRHRPPFAAAPTASGETFHLVVDFSPATRLPRCHAVRERRRRRRRRGVPVYAVLVTLESSETVDARAWRCAARGRASCASRGRAYAQQGGARASSRAGSPSR